MSILIDQNTRLLVQGITGAEGSRACRDMVAYGTNVLAGVTPGKGGQDVDGVPVYNSIAEAMAAHPAINASLIAVPGRFAKNAALEAIAASIPLINILTEHVTTADSSWIATAAKNANVRVIGPSSVGIISPGKAKIGGIGLAKMAQNYSAGSVGLMSKSGGMTSEIALALTRAGLGQSTALGVGGDSISGSDFASLLPLFAADDETRAVVIFGEVGGTAEERAAEWIVKNNFQKPIVALVAGNFGDALPEGTVLGHAGAIVSRGRGGYDSKVSALRDAGAHIANSVEEIPLLLKPLITL